MSKPSPYFQSGHGSIYCGDAIDCLQGMPGESMNCCVTSPPYWGLRDYNCEGQMGLEATPQEYVENMTAVFREVRRVLRDDGTLWLIIGDSYAAGGMGGHQKGDTFHGHSKRTGDRVPKRAPPGLKPKDLVGIPWMLAFALRADGWYLRSDIIWSKPNPMPESVTDRPTKAHEYLFLMSKSQKYFYDFESIKEPVSESTVARLSQPKLSEQTGSDRVPFKTNGNMKAVGDKESRNRRTVWSITTKPFKEAHFATFPPDLIEPCVKAGCPVGGVILDPFLGSGTTAEVAIYNKRNFCGIEISKEYLDTIARPRIENVISGLPMPIGETDRLISKKQTIQGELFDE